MIRDENFLNQLSRIIAVILDHLNSEDGLVVMQERLCMQGNGVIYSVPIGSNTAWGNHLLFRYHGRFYTLAITHSEYFELYPRLLEYYVAYWKAEKYLKEQYGEPADIGEISTIQHSMQNYCFWNLKAGKLGIQQSDRDGEGSLVTEIVFIPQQWLHTILIPVFMTGRIS